MKTEELVKVFQDASGLDDEQAKTAIYYAMATHEYKRFSWFPVLAFVGPPGTGKSKCLDVMRQLCFKSYPIACHSTMSPASLRDELIPSKKKVTAIIEEADLYPNRKQLQSYLISRVDKTRTSGLAVKEQVETADGVRGWRTTQRSVFGPTVMHDRNSLDDLAADSRVITIPTMFKTGIFKSVPNKLSLPKFSLGSVPGHFNISGRALDTWTPLIQVADGVGDGSWNCWALLQIEAATDNLRDAHAYEEKSSIFAQVIKGYCDAAGGVFLVKPDVGLVLQSAVVESLRKEMPSITPHLVHKVLTDLGLTVKRHGGTNRLFTTVEKLKEVASAIGYEDDILK